MTKAWEPVKADICRYYAAGKPLIDVKELLETEKGFKASYDAADLSSLQSLTPTSIRAYRLKIAEWDVKRPRTFRQSSPAPKPQGGAADDYGESTIISHVVRDDEQLTSPATGASDGATTVTAAHKGPHGRQDVACPCQCKAKKLEYLLYWIQEASRVSNGPQSLDWIEQEDPFSDGVDNILHFATRMLEKLRKLQCSTLPEKPRELYGSIVAHFQRFNLDINARDCNRMTALEIAIRQSDSEATTMLLLAGASLLICSVPGETLLSMCMLRFPSHQITAEILPRQTKHGLGKDMEPYEKLCVEAFRLACSNVEGSTEPVRVAESFRMLRLLLERGFVLGIGGWTSTDVDAAFRALVERWEWHAQLLWKESLNDTALYCCKRLLQQGANILLTTDRHPAHKRWQFLDVRADFAVVETLAELAINHLPDTALAGVIAEHHSVVYGERLARILMAPCPLRILPSDGDTPQAVLRRILARQPRLAPKLLLFALKVTPNSLKCDSVQVILPSSEEKSVLAQMSQAKCSSAIIDALVKVDEDLRWRLSELIFPYDAAFQLLRKKGATSSSKSSADRLSCFGDDAGYLDHLYHCVRDRCEQDSVHTFWTALFDSTWTCSWCDGTHYWHEEAETKMSHRTREIQRCTIHVLTKMLLDEDSVLGHAMQAKLRVSRALRLRRKFNLPDITIDKSLLLDAME